jgi:hypothetical protein
VAISPELITFKALQLIGSGQYTMDDIATYLEFLRGAPAIAAEMAACVTGRYAVRDANQALSVAREGRGIKTVFVSER